MAKTGQQAGGLNKKSLAEALAARMGVSQAVADEAVENVFDICAQKVAQGSAISISNFGTFERITRQPRLARNPHTGGRMQVPERQAVRFVVSPRLNRFANSSNPEEMTIRKKPKSPSKKTSNK